MTHPRSAFGAPPQGGAPSGPAAPDPRRPLARRQHGFTLIEVLTACAVAALLMAIALPSLRAPLLRAHRTDAVGTLLRLQAAQERQRSSAGGYTASLAQLQLPERSDEGLYAVALELTGPDSYRASASVLAGTPQAADLECAQITLVVNGGFATPGPSLRCWNR